MQNHFEDIDLEAALQTLRNGGIILYPTDTIWGLGCDATNKNSVQRIYAIKQRPDNKSLIILVTEETDILKFVADPDPAVFDFLQNALKPTTIIFNNAINLPDNLIAEDGTVAIRLVKDNFCRHLVKRLQRPIISTSANISGHPSPTCFNEIEKTLKEQVDYIVKWRQDDLALARPSQIIKWGYNGDYQVIRQ